MGAALPAQLDRGFDPSGEGDAMLAAGSVKATRRELRAIDYIIALIYERSRIRMDRGKEALIQFGFFKL